MIELSIETTAKLFRRGILCSENSKLKSIRKESIMTEKLLIFRVNFGGNVPPFLMHSTLAKTVSALNFKLKREPLSIFPFENF